MEKLISVKKIEENPTVLSVIYTQIYLFGYREKQIKIVRSESGNWIPLNGSYGLMEVPFRVDVKHILNNIEIKLKLGETYEI